MFDVLLSLMAIGSSAIEMKTIKEALNTPYNGDTEFLFEKEKPCFEQEPVEEIKETQPKRPKRNQIEEDRKLKEIQRQKRLAAQAAKEEEITDPVVQWIFDHDELVLNILQNPGKHIIKNEEFKGIDKESIADFLFGQNTIESVEIISDGLEVISR